MNIFSDLITLDATTPSLWVNGWFKITKEELEVIKGINNRIKENNNKVRESMEYQKKERYNEYLRLKTEFEFYEDTIIENQ